MSRTKNSVRNIIFTFINAVVIYVLPFFLRRILVLQLGENYLGLNNLFHSVISVLTLAEAGVGSALSYCMYKPISEGDNQKVCALLCLYRKIYLIIGVVIAIVGICFTPFLDRLIESDYPSEVNIYVVYLIYLSETVFSYLFFAYKSSLISANQRKDIEAKINIIVTSISYVLRIIILIVFKNYYLYIVALPITAMIYGIVVNVVSKRKYPNYYCCGEVDFETKKQLFGHSKSLFIQKMGDVFSNSLGNIVISYNLGLIQVAIYSNYMYVYKSLRGLIAQAMNSITANVGNSSIENTVKKNYHVFMVATTANNWLICWSGCCLLCLYQQFIKMWVGDKLIASNEVVFLSVALFIVRQIIIPIDIFKNANGIWKKDEFRPLISGVANALLSVVLVRKIGIIGAILPNIICQFFIDYIWEKGTLFKEYFNIRTKEYNLYLMKNMITIFVSMFICYKVCLYIDKSDFISFIIKGTTCFCISNIIFILMNIKNIYFKDLVILIKTFLTNLIPGGKKDAF